MTPDQIHEAHRGLKQLDKLHEARKAVNRSIVIGVYIELQDADEQLLPVSETAVKGFIDQQITRLEDALRSLGVVI